MAPTKSPNAILSETTTINSFGEQMIVLFGYWWSRGLVMIFYHACLLLPLTAGSSLAKKLILIICLQRISLLLSLMRAIIQRVTAASVSGLYFVTISLFFLCSVNISYRPDRAQYSLHMGYCILKYPYPPVEDFLFVAFSPYP